MVRCAVRGRVLCLPEVIQGQTSFLLLAESKLYRIFRDDPPGQVRDLLFLREGMLLQVQGFRLPKNRILAQTIHIEQARKQ